MDVAYLLIIGELGVLREAVVGSRALCKPIISTCKIHGASVWARLEPVVLRHELLLPVGLC